MYLAQTFKFRYGELTDFFVCKTFPEKEGVCSMKEKVLYFLYIDGKILGPYKTYHDCRYVWQAFELYQLIHENKILVIESRRVSQEITQEKLYLRTAAYEDLERNALFWEYANKSLNGPFQMYTDISAHDSVLIQKIKEGTIFIINEKQKFDR